MSSNVLVEVALLSRFQDFLKGLDRNQFVGDERNLLTEVTDVLNSGEHYDENRVDVLGAQLINLFWIISEIQHTLKHNYGGIVTTEHDKYNPTKSKTIHSIKFTQENYDKLQELLGSIPEMEKEVQEKRDKLAAQMQISYWESRVEKLEKENREWKRRNDNAAN